MTRFVPKQSGTHSLDIEHSATGNRSGLVANGGFNARLKTSSAVFKHIGLDQIRKNVEYKCVQ